MSNVEGQTRYEKITEWMVPLRDGKCTARDMADLMRVAQQKAEEIDHKAAQMDDRYYFEFDEDYVKVSFRTEVKQGQVLEL